MEGLQPAGVCGGLRGVLGRVAPVQSAMRRGPAGAALRGGAARRPRGQSVRVEPRGAQDARVQPAAVSAALRGSGPGLVHVEPF